MKLVGTEKIEMKVEEKNLLWQNSFHSEWLARMVTKLAGYHYNIQ